MKRRYLWLLALTVGSAVAYHATFVYLDMEDLEALPVQITRSDADHTPQMCVGYNTIQKNFNPSVGECSSGYAFFLNDDSREIAGPCCRLPANDILTEEHLHGVHDRCPDNFVVTGGNGATCGNACTMRCTRINTERYQLGLETRGFYWKIEGKYPFGGRGLAKQITHQRIPLAIRHAAGRMDKEWDIDGCIGVPFGSLLVGHRKLGCANSLYRQLLFNDGTPVKMFPDCKEIDGLDSATPRCIK